MRAAIFDIDGVLLDLTGPEAETFFDTFRTLHRIAEDHLDPDWNSYRVRNDLAIIAEILERHFRRPAAAHEVEAVAEAYLRILEQRLADGALTTSPVAGVRDLLDRLTARPELRLGLATANLEGAARTRLGHAGLWDYFTVGSYAESGGGGPKSAILAELIARLDGPDGPCPRDHIVFLGDQVGDLRAARDNGVHFIGISTDPEARERLADHGAEIVLDGHARPEELVCSILRLV